MPSRAHVACLNLAPWSLTLLERQQPGVPVAVLSEGGRRVVQVNELALTAGIQPGMRESAALSRCPELHAEVVNGPTASAAWNELLELLYARFSDRVEGEAGLAYLMVSEGHARELAAALHAPVGLAASKEVALLAALRAKAGEVKEVAGTAGGQGEKLFLQLTPLRDLWALGVSREQVEQLRFLGMTGLADLWTWSAAQREAFLGVDTGKRMARFLKGERTTQVQRYASGQVLESCLDVDAPLHEPGELKAALLDVMPPLWNELRGRTAAYLTVQAETVAGTLSATRKLKWPLDEAGSVRLAGLALAETPALSLGIDRVRFQLSGLQQPSRMVGLWAGLAELEVTRQVLDRYPEALVRVHWLDPYAYATDAMYEWMDWLTGEVRPTSLTPKRPTPSPIQKRQKSIERVLAFFEGAQP